MVATALMLALCLLGAYVCRIQPRRPRRLLWLGTAAVWIAWAGMAYQWQRSAYAGRVLTIQPLLPVACIGDSLTKFGYPACLQELVSLPVVDLSCSGITSEQALTIIPALLRANPQVVVIELGGHDYLKGRSRSATRENLEKLVAASRSIGAEVIIMEIPRGFITDPFGGLEREMARQDHLELIPDTAIRRLVLWSPAAPPGMWLRREQRLSDDGLHPNSRGNQMLAEYVAEALRGMYGPAVLKSR
jgi:lysophospholipase L1-like esterase